MSIVKYGFFTLGILRWFTASLYQYPANNSSQYVLASPAQITPAPEYHTYTTPSCYSYTQTVPYTGIGPFPSCHARHLFQRWQIEVHCPELSVCGPYANCILQAKSFIEVPCANEKCPSTLTVTFTAPPICPTCQVGCATSVLLETITTGCRTASSYWGWKIWKNAIAEYLDDQWGCDRFDWTIWRDDDWIHGIILSSKIKKNASTFTLLR